MPTDGSMLEKPFPCDGGRERSPDSPDSWQGTKLNSLWVLDKFRASTALHALDASGQLGRADGPVSMASTASLRIANVGIWPRVGLCPQVLTGERLHTAGLNPRVHGILHGVPEIRLLVVEIMLECAAVSVGVNVVVQLTV